MNPLLQGAISSRSNAIISAEPPTSAPAGLVSSNITTTGATLTWTYSGTGNTGFVIQRTSVATPQSSDFVDLATTGEGVVTFSDAFESTLNGITYTYRVAAINSLTRQRSTYSSNLAVVIPQRLPLSITNLQQNMAGTTETAIKLTWTNPANNNNSGFKLKIAAGTSGNFSTEITIAGASTSEYTNTGLTAGTQYSYQLYATNPTGDATLATSATLNGATTLFAYPSGPATFIISSVDATSITVSWTYTESPPNNSDGFVIYYKLSTASTYSDSVTSAQGTTSKEVTGLTQSSTYDFKIYSKNSRGQSTGFLTAQGTTTSSSAPGSEPNAPTSLAYNSLAGTSLNLTWSAPVGGGTVQGYTVQQRIYKANPPFNSWTTVTTGASSPQSITNLNPNTSYDFQVCATNTIGSACAILNNITTLMVVPGTVTNFSKSSTTTTISLSWTDLSNETKYELSRSSNNGTTYSTAKELSQNATSYTDNGSDFGGLVQGTTYTYRIRGVNAQGNGEYSTVTALLTQPLPSSSTNFTAALVPISSSTSVKLTWNPGANATTYKIERKKGSEDFINIIEGGFTTLEYIDQSCEPNTEYTYRLFGLNVVGSTQSTPPTVTVKTTVQNEPPVSDNVISNLFSSDTEGAWYDPSDLSTLFQDFSGTPVTDVEQPVMLMLDKSRGLALGPERIYNGYFNIRGPDPTTGQQSIIGWFAGNPGSATIPVTPTSIYGLEASYSSATTSPVGLFYQPLGIQNNSLQTSKVYKLTVTFESFRPAPGSQGSGSLRFAVFNNFNELKYFAGEDIPPSYVKYPELFVRPGIEPPTTITRYFIVKKTAVDPLASTQPVLNYFAILYYGGPNNHLIFNITNISLKEVLGNHAFWYTGLPYYSDKRNVPRLAAKVNLLNISTDNVTSSTNFRVPSNVSTFNSLILSFTGTGTVSLVGTIVPTASQGPSSQGTHTISILGTANSSFNTIVVNPAGQVNNLDIRWSNSGTNIPSYQRVTSKYVYEKNGFPYYLRFYRTEDATETIDSRPCLMTNWFDLGSASAVSVFTGFKLLFTAREGGFPFNLFGPPYTTQELWPRNLMIGARFSLYSEIGFYNAGLSGAYNVSATGGTNAMNYTTSPSSASYLISPRSNIIGTVFNLPLQNTNSVTMRINNSTPGRQSSGFTGTNLTSPFGNNYNLYIGAEWVDDSNAIRNFPCNLYSLIIVGTAIDLNSSTSINSWINNKMGGGNL